MFYTYILFFYIDSIIKIIYSPNIIHEIITIIHELAHNVCMYHTVLLNNIFNKFLTQV